jgi:hypothetical protein
VCTKPFSSAHCSLRISNLLRNSMGTCLQRG